MLQTDWDIQPAGPRIRQLLASNNVPAERLIFAAGLFRAEQDIDEVLPVYRELIELPETRNQFQTLPLALQTLGEHVSELAPVLLKMLEDPQINPHIVFESFKKMGPHAKAIVPKLVEYFSGGALAQKNPDFVQRQLIDVFGAIGPGAKDATDLLIDEVQHQDTNRHYSALSALSKIRPTDKRSLNHLFAAGMDSDKPGTAFRATRLAVELLEESGQSARRRFVDRGSFIEDTRTGLLWQKDGAVSGQRNFFEAETICQEAQLGWADRVARADGRRVGFHSSRRGPAISELRVRRTDRSSGATLLDVASDRPRLRVHLSLDGQRWFE